MRRKRRRHTVGMGTSGWSFVWLHRQQWRVPLTSEDLGAPRVLRRKGELFEQVGRSIEWANDDLSEMQSRVSSGICVVRGLSCAAGEPPASSQAACRSRSRVEA